MYNHKAKIISSQLLYLTSLPISPQTSTEDFATVCEQQCMIMSTHHFNYIISFYDMYISATSVLLFIYDRPATLSECITT